MESITNALSQPTSILAYDAHGQPKHIVDSNGLVTALTYNARGKPLTRSVGGETTTYEYDLAEQLTKVTLPDGSFLSYSYDDAHRLTAIQDNLGNNIAYTLDGMGNRTLEEVRDPANALAQTRSRVYSNLNRLFQELGATSQTTEYTYDDQGNVLTVKDPLNRVTTNQYDALNRLKQVTSPTPISAVTQYAYDGIDQLASVTDPRSLVTGYAVDGLGNLNVQTSPDTGTTTNDLRRSGQPHHADRRQGPGNHVRLRRAQPRHAHHFPRRLEADVRLRSRRERHRPAFSITETNPAQQVTSCSPTPMTSTAA